MQNRATIPHRIANDVIVLIFNPGKKNSPRSVDQKNVIRIIVILQISQLRIFRTGTFVFFCEINSNQRYYYYDVIQLNSQHSFTIYSQSREYYFLLRFQFRCYGLCYYYSFTLQWKLQCLSIFISSTQFIRLLTKCYSNSKLLIGINTFF